MTRSKLGGEGRGFGGSRGGRQEGLETPGRGKVVVEAASQNGLGYHLRRIARARRCVGVGGGRGREEGGEGKRRYEKSVGGTRSTMEKKEVVVESGYKRELGVGLGGREGKKGGRETECAATPPSWLACRLVSGGKPEFGSSSRQQ